MFARWRSIGVLSGLAFVVGSPGLHGCTLDEAGQGVPTCGADTVLCNGVCVDMNFDPSHCGGCGNACPAGQVCSSGTCGFECLGGTTRCDAVCADLTVDPGHCGTCDNACAFGEACVAGTCGKVCSDGLSICNGACVDVMSSPDHCGACDNACFPGQACFGGVCKGSVCEPGKVELCYTGPAGTLNIGACRPGTKTCDAAGTGFGSCVGEIVPAIMDSCTDLIDDDCNGMIEPCLFDTGLVVRYYMDEANNGSGPSQLTDTGPYAFNLPITSYTSMDYSEYSGNRCLEWSLPGISGRAQRAIDNSMAAQPVQTALQGANKATFEIVMNIDAVNNGGSMLMHIGTNSPYVSLLTQSSSEIRFYFNSNNMTAGEWTGDLINLGRTVWHLVLDTTQASALDRVKLYLDGTLVVKTGGAINPALNSVMNIGMSRDLVIGNDSDGSESMNGRIFYAAIYNTAFTDTEVAQNAAVLRIDDDTPSAP